MPKLLFIVGMQKSGTSLLNRMLMKQPFIENPFLPEGASFWGDLPPFTPVASPCGALYQKHQGLNGHALDGEDFNQADNRLLLERIMQADIKAPLLMNKNPYNAVRTAWLKKHFPEAKIYAVIRNPVANVYSLLKKYVADNDQGVGPENGWWGIKPKSWQLLLNQDKLIQCTQQWKAVNQDLINNQNNIDHLIDYDLICTNPNAIIQMVQKEFDIQAAKADLPACKSFNNEYLRGSRLTSKNQELRKSEKFNLVQLNEVIEFPPLMREDIEYIQNQSNPLWETLQAAQLQL